MFTGFLFWIMLLASLMAPDYAASYMVDTEVCPTDMVYERNARWTASSINYGPWLR